MWLACALIVLVTVGLVLPCMLDVAMTPEAEFATLGKSTWLVICGAFWIFGAAAWLIAGRPRRFINLRHRGQYLPGLDPADAVYRHPAAQAAGFADPAMAMGGYVGGRPMGPDDDPDFLSELDRRIRGSREDDAPESY